MEPITFQLCKRTASFFYVQNELPVSTYTCTFQTGSATIEELILGGQGDTVTPWTDVVFALGKYFY